MNAWIDDLAQVLSRDERCVLVTVTTVRGSAPREPGAKMIVTARESIGTIGGGQLEYLCTQIAAETLSNVRQETSAFTRKFPLGTNCGQCCGGVVDVMFEQLEQASGEWFDALRRLSNERRPAVLVTSMAESMQKYVITGSGDEVMRGSKSCPNEITTIAREIANGNEDAQRRGDYFFEPVRESRFHIAIFGAGHVGAACIDVLSRIDASIRWIESRRNLFPAILPRNVTAIEAEDPAREVGALPAGAFYLVMTHSHPLDLELCMRILRRDDYAYCGLIGSVSKRRRFERLMQKQGITDESLRRLICPIGVTGIDGKQPAEIALSVSAQLLQTRDRLRQFVASTRNNEMTAVDMTNIHAL